MFDFSDAIGYGSVAKSEQTGSECAIKFRCFAYSEAVQIQGDVFAQERELKMFKSTKSKSSNRVFDSSEHFGGIGGELPKWDLSDLYESTDSEHLARDFAWLEKACESFREKYESKLEDIDASELFDSIAEYERIESVVTRISSFAKLRYFQDTSDPERVKFESECDERITKISAPLVFFSLELNKIGDARLADMLSENESLRKYKPYLEKTRKLKPYQLSMELEQFLHDKSVVGMSA